MNDRLEKKPPAPGRRISIALAIAVHLVLAIFLFYGVHWQSERPEAVEVELVRALPEPSTPAPAPEIKPEPRPEPPPPPPPEPKPAPREPEIAVKEKPKPPPKKELPKPPPPKEVPKPLPKVAPKPLPKAAPPLPFADALKREDEQRVRNDAEAAAARELQQIEAARRRAAADSAMDAYLGKIRSKIRGNILLPPGVKGNPEAVFDVTQLPSGEILSVRLKQSSGHRALDDAITRAILKSSPLPKPDSAGLFERQLVLSFKPLEE